MKTKQSFFIKQNLKHTTYKRLLLALIMKRNVLKLYLIDFVFPIFIAKSSHVKRNAILIKEEAE